MKTLQGSFRIRFSAIIIYLALTTLLSTTVFSSIWRSGIATSVAAAAEPAVAAVATQPAAQAGAAASVTKIDRAKWDEITLLGSNDRQFRLANVRPRVIVAAFVGVECPLANLYLPKLDAFAARFANDAVTTLAINSNEQDAVGQIREQQQKLGLKIELLKDAGNRLADLLNAQRTPEIVVLDADLTIVYRGRFDDQFGYNFRRKDPTTNELDEAVAAVMAGKSPAVATTEVEGCHIGRKRTPRDGATVSFYRDVLPVLQKHCQVCHRSGEIAPFTLFEYDEVSGWAETIKEVVQQRRMPPWLADPSQRHFSNDTRLSDEEIATLVSWVDAGAPAGDPAAAPPAVTFSEGWAIGTPDAVYAMPVPFSVPATGVIDYQYFTVSAPANEDRWVKSIECRPGQPGVVHHILAMLTDPQTGDSMHDGLSSGFFAASAPGATSITFPDGQAKLLPKGKVITLQMHYTPNGTAVKDQSRVGVIWAKEQPKFEVQTYGLAKRKFVIPAGAADHAETRSIKLPKAFTVTTLFPHLHIRGKSFKYTVTYPNGKTEELLNVPRWDFNWQLNYRFAEPKQLPAGTQLTVEAHWDNSAANPNNILPLTDVRWGDQSFEEMFIGYIDHVVPVSSR